MNWIYNNAKSPCESSRQAATKRQASLTKPLGSLGRLEEIAIHLAALQGQEKPKLECPAIRIFAADHGVVEEGVSAYPQEVTAQMIGNFAEGGAAISVLAKELGSDLQIVNMGTATAVPDTDSVKQHAIAAGTSNFCKQAAMTKEQLEKALNVGGTVADEAKTNDVDILIIGEMGIGNTSSAAALACAVLDKSAEELVGRGTGVDDAGLQRKIKAVQTALALHMQSTRTPLDYLRCLGGFEIAAMAGCYIRAAQIGIPSLVDGFICTSAALLASKINESVQPWLLFSHQSAEQGHRILLNAMQAKPILSLDMRLGEGSGAALTLPLLLAACSLHNNMASFEEAGISNK